MKTFAAWATGWILGGVAIVAMAGGVHREKAQAKAQAKAERRLEASVPVVVPGTTLRTSAAPRRGDFRGDLVVPVQGISVDDLRDNFNQIRGGGRTHGAIDILAPRGTPVVAAVNGTIRKLFNSRAGGITLYQFDEKEERVYYYAHLDRYADDVAEGLFIEQGRVIGYVGTSGNAAPDTPHLHFAIETLTPEKVWWKGTPLNPYPLLTARASTLP